MGVNHYNWDYRPEVSLADYLQAQGFDVWIPGLRGDPGSLAPSRRARRDFNFDDHALRDIPAAMDLVLEESEHEALVWVGHSLGGMLYYSSLEAHADKLMAGVSVCSPSTFQEQSKLYRRMIRHRWLFGGRGVLPARAATKLTLPLGRANPIFGVIANKDNSDWSLIRGIASRGITNLSKGTARQGLMWLDSATFSQTDGTPWNLTSDVPTLVLAGAGDRLIPRANVTEACEHLSDCTIQVLGEGEGFVADYGHIDALLGAEARREVYPLISGFLLEHSAHGE
jgi:pimeloyl-ACP methyl ester carboxylesterase